MIDLNGKRFTLASNSAGNAKPGETVFTFEQNGRAVRATYNGGDVRLGAVVGHFQSDDLLLVLFQQMTVSGRLCGGEGKMKIEIASDGKISFIDDWRFTTNGEGNGQAIWQEL